VCLKILLGILGYCTLPIWGLFEVGTPTRPPRGRPCQTPCSYAWRSECLYTTFDQDHDLVFFSFLASNQPCCLLQYSGTTLRERLQCPLVFFVMPTYWETCFTSSRYSTYFFSFFFGSSYRPSCPPRCSDTTLWVHPWRPLYFFIVVSIYWKSASYMSSLDLTAFSKTTNRLAAKMICSFLLNQCARYSTSWWLQDFVMTPSSRCAYTSLGACETWVRLGPYWPGSWPSLTSGSSLPEDPLT
jgi:hypothetical protein